MFRRATPLIPKPKRPLWKSLLRVAMALTCAYLIATAIRVAAIQATLHETIKPELWTRLSVVEAPISVQSPNGSNTSQFSAGYASFGFPHDTQLTMRAPAYVHAEAGSISVWLAPPMEADASEETLAQLDSLSQGLWSRWKHWVLPAVGAEIHQPRSVADVDWNLIEVTPRSFWRLLWADTGESIAYTIRLLMKSLLLHCKVERLLRFEGPETVGVIFTNEDGASGGVALSSRDRKISQVMTFKLHPKPAALPGDELSAFLASYRFKVGRPITKDEAAAMIVDAGVPLSADTPHDRDAKD